MNQCLYCSKNLKRTQFKYCSNKCQADLKYQEYIKNWENGFVHGDRGINTKNISGHIKRFLIDKFGEKCSICNWSIKHSITNNVPLEIDHINGDSEDNREENLRLICPNCHSLSSNYKNLNKGNGRKWRKEKYLKNN